MGWFERLIYIEISIVYYAHEPISIKIFQNARIRSLIAQCGRSVMNLQQSPFSFSLHGLWFTLINAKREFVYMKLNGAFDDAVCSRIQHPSSIIYLIIMNCVVLGNCEVFGWKVFLRVGMPMITYICCCDFCIIYIPFEPF